MKSFLKAFAIVCLTLALGCSGSGRRHIRVTIILNNGIYGYYYNNQWCDFTNNYCGTGQSCGISDDGTTYSGDGYGDIYNNNNSSGGGGGGWNNNNNNGGGWNNNNNNGGGWNNNDNNGGGWNNNDNNGGGWGNNDNNGGGWGGNNNNGGGSGNNNNNGWSVRNKGNYVRTVVGQAKSEFANLNKNIFAGRVTHSASSKSVDTDLQIAQVQQADFEARAEQIANRFQMELNSARQLTQLADKVEEMTRKSGLSSDDREAITESALGVAGISTDEVNQAIGKMLDEGNQKPIDALMNKAARNLGMPSSVGIREELLPALGIRF